jgi:shikimate kinase
VYLEAAVETLLERLAGDLGRPLLRGEDREEAVRELLSRREPWYRTADATVRTDGRTVKDVAGQVADWIDRTEGRAG